MLPFVKKKASKNSSHLMVSQDTSQDAGERHTMDIAPPIGRTNRPVYWSVVLASLLVLSMMITAIAHGGVAVAAAGVPIPVNLTIGTLSLTSTSIHVAIADTGQTALIRSNVVATNVVQTVTVNAPGLGLITARITIAKLVIRGLVNPVAIPGGVVPNANMRAFLETTLSWDSALIEGISISIIRS